MGSYLNPGGKGFRESLHSEIYVDKTMLIDRTNAVLNTRQKYICVSRPRRFGKSMAADMLAAYYDREEDSGGLFEIRTMDWHEVAGALEDSRRLLESLWAQNAAAVAEGIERAHREISSLQYNDENTLSCVVNLVFYSAREYYTIVREFPSGTGFVDICFIPRKLHLDKSAVIIELKWGQSASAAIAQIRDRQYNCCASKKEGS